MAWGKVDDKLHVNTKFARVSLEAIGLWTLCLSWCNDALTDGQVPRQIVERFAGGRAKKLAGELVSAGLWREVGGSYQMIPGEGWGVEPDGQDLRKTSAYRQWRRAVFERDCYQCRMCWLHADRLAEQGLRLHAHHIKHWAKHPESRFDVSNGITYCELCHATVHEGTRK